MGHRSETQMFLGKDKLQKKKDGRQDVSLDSCGQVV